MFRTTLRIALLLCTGAAFAQVDTGAITGRVYDDTRATVLQWTQRVKLIQVETPRPAPPWAIMERQVIEVVNRAGEEFVRTYANPDGSMRWKDRYKGGMNSSDDSYEAFRGFSLHYILGGSRELDRLHRWVWEGLTREWTRYGNVYREFDSNWDWMHHAEGYVDFYTFGLADPLDEKFSERAKRFAAMYIGDDPESPNYDPERNMMRASMTGSRGPKMAWTVRDWIPTNANLTYLHLPFDDIPGVKSPEAWVNDGTFATIVKVMSDRMARGDIPLNLTSTPLVVNAYLYTGDEKYKSWVLQYLQGWIDRTKQNGGITPDNIGLSGKIGEYMNGNWWGGYYGWKWVGGGGHIVRAEITAAKAAMLLTGEPKWLDLPRSQLEVMRSQGKTENGVFLVPGRYDQRGWHFFQPEQASPWIWLWILSQDGRDMQQIQRIAKTTQPRTPEAEDHYTLTRPADDDLPWIEFLNGRNPGYPEKALADDLEFTGRKMRYILNEHGDPETWVDDKWSSANPVLPDGLLRLTTGTIPILLQGELLSARLRYFDPVRREPGLPEGVAALVTRLGPDSTDVELVNTNLFERRNVVVQGGAYGEHQIKDVSVEGRIGKVSVNDRFFEVSLDPGTGAKLHIAMKRFANKPAYAFPWHTKGAEAR